MRKVQFLALATSPSQYIIPSLKKSPAYCSEELRLFFRFEMVSTCFNMFQLDITQLRNP